MFCLHGQACRPPVAGMQRRQRDALAVTHQQCCTTKTLRTRKRQRRCCAQAAQADAAHQARAGLVQLKRELQAAVEAEVSRHLCSDVSILHRNAPCCGPCSSFQSSANNSQPSSPMGQVEVVH